MASYAKERLVLVDGSAVFYRGYYAIPHLTNKEGMPTNAVYGFTTIFLKMLADLKPKYVIVAWDKGSQTFRKDMYADYKATRKAMPDDLRAQIPTLKELVAGLKLPFIEVDNYEADDIIGTLAWQAEKRGDLETIVVTGDLDELQLVDENTVVRIAKPNGEAKTYDIEAVKERYGVTPKQFIDVKALKGDASDNIPGVPGIGEKGAVDLIMKYGSLDAVYEHADEQSKGLVKKLTEGKELAYLSQKLSTIVLDVPIELDLHPAEVGQYDRDHVHELFRRLDFKSLLAKLPPELSVEGDAATSAAPGELTLFSGNEITEKSRKHLETATYCTITTEEQLDDLISKLAKLNVFAFDTETTGVDTTIAELVGISVSWDEAVAYYIPVGHVNGIQLDRTRVLDALKPIFENAAIGKVGHNIKFDYEMMFRYGITVRGVAFDTMVAAFLLNSLGRAQSLDDLAFHEFGIEMIPITELIGSGKSQTTFDLIKIDQATTYAAEDADISWRLFQKLKPQLEAAGDINDYGWNLERLGREIEWPIIPVLGQMELAGIKLDVPFLTQFGAKLRERLNILKAAIFDSAGEEFNLGSPAQLAQVLYGRLGLSTAGLKRGKTGFSTAAAELEKLRSAHPIVEMIMQYRELDKLMSTYVDALPNMVRHDGRIHTSFNQTIAQTGRLSSTNPNLQNIPVRTELGREIRQAFIAPKGRVLVSADYSQIELRVAAALSGDEAMIQTFKDGIDLHAQTAAELFEVELADVTKEQRYNSKTINFGVLYGMSAHGLAIATGMDREQAQHFIDRYFEVRPKLKSYIERTKKFAYDNQYTETVFGRRRPCPEIRSSNFQFRQAAERMAVNVPIQGTAADIYKLSMIRLAEKLLPQDQLLLQIHDELIVETDEARGEEMAQLMREVMSSAFEIGVPLAVDTAVGTNWGQL
jgi:DNA polymerase-1